MADHLVDGPPDKRPKLSNENAISENSDINYGVWDLENSLPEELLTVGALDQSDNSSRNPASQSSDQQNLMNGSSDSEGNSVGSPTSQRQTQRNVSHSTVPTSSHGRMPTAQHIPYSHLHANNERMSPTNTSVNKTDIPVSSSHSSVSAGTSLNTNIYYGVTNQSESLEIIYCNIPQKKGSTMGSLNNLGPLSTSVTGSQHRPSNVAQQFNPTSLINDGHLPLLAYYSSLNMNRGVNPSVSSEATYSSPHQNIFGFSSLSNQGANSKTPDVRGQTNNTPFHVYNAVSASQIGPATSMSSIAPIVPAPANMQHTYTSGWIGHPSNVENGSASINPFIQRSQSVAVSHVNKQTQCWPLNLSQITASQPAQPSQQPRPMLQNGGSEGIANSSYQSFPIAYSLQSIGKAPNAASLSTQPNPVASIFTGAVLKNPSTTKDWHQFVAQDLRQHSVQKIMKALSSPTDISSSQNYRMIGLDDYARKIEGDMYEAANTREEYCKLIAKKIYKIQTPFEENRQKGNKRQKQVGPGLFPILSSAPTPNPTAVRTSQSSQGPSPVYMQGAYTALGLPYNAGNGSASINPVIQRSQSVTVPLDQKSKPEMIEYSIRLSTFNDWPLSFLLPQKLAKYGFYYTGTEDIVTCYCCGGTIKRWKLEDDPFFVHEKFYPTCRFLHYMRESGKIPFKPRSEAFYQNNIIRRACEMFPIEMVEKATLMSDIIDQSSTLEELIEEILKFDTKENPSLPIESKISIDRTNPNEVLQCKICLENEMCIVFQPCGHFATCSTCSNQIDKCPICRKPIKSKIKTYIS